MRLVSKVCEFPVDPCPDDPSPRVSVIVPCYNSERTIDRTLDSVRAQTLDAIEIIVVDDGSTDSSAARVRQHCAQDHRIRLIQQRNAGVAASRNAGAAAAHAPYLAFVDADDVWAPEKLARQVERMEADGEPVGLVYCWFCRIDADDVILGYDSASVEEGDVLSAICGRNLIGNGSSVLVRSDAFRDSGGFDPDLRERDAQGCEDYDFYARIAGKWRFGLVREFLVGYRITPDNMSSNLVRMVRSRIICSERLLARHPEHGLLIRHGRRRFLRWSIWRAVQQRRLGEVWKIGWTMLRLEPFVHLLELPGILLRARQARRLAARIGPPDPRNRFAIGVPILGQEQMR